jgi:hypothetical protein
MSDTSRPVPSSADGSYIRPPSVQQQIAEKLKRMPKVDAHGHDLLPADPDPTVAPIVDPATPQARTPRPNPLQGVAGGVSVPTPPVGSTLEQLADQLAHQLADPVAPIPEGFVPAPPR